MKHLLEYYGFSPNTKSFVLRIDTLTLEEKNIAERFLHIFGINSRENWNETHKESILNNYILVDLKSKIYAYHSHTCFHGDSYIVSIPPLFVIEELEKKYSILSSFQKIFYKNEKL